MALRKVNKADFLNTISKGASDRFMDTIRTNADSYRSQQEQNRINSTVTVAPEYISNFQDNVNKFFGDDKFQNNRRALSILANQSKLIRKYYNTNRSRISSDDFNNAMKYLDAVDMKMNPPGEDSPIKKAKAAIENLDANSKEEARLRGLSYDELVKEYNDKQSKVTTEANTVEDILIRIKDAYLYSDEYANGVRDPEKEKDIKYIDTVLGIPGGDGSRLSPDVVKRYMSPDKNSKEYKDAYAYLTNKYGKELGTVKQYGDPNKALTTNDGKILTYKNLIYDAENKEQFEKLRGNEQSLSTYEELDAIDNDIATISSIISTKQANGYYTPTDRDAEKKNYIAQKYNVNLDDSNAVEIGNELINKLKNDKAVKVEFLNSKEGGEFDYERMREYANRQVEAQDQAYLNSKYSDFARQFPLLATVGSMSLAPLQGIEGLEGVVDGLTEDEYDPKNYAPIDYNSMGITSMNQSLTSAVSQAIADGTYLKDGTALMKGMSDRLVDEYGLTKEEADIQVMSALYNEGLHKFLSTTYGGVSSAIQSRGIALATSALGTAIGTAYTGNPVAGASIGNTVGEALTLTIMSSQAMASSLYDGLERGLDNESAVYTALASGINEAVFEKLSFENFMKLKTSINPQSLGKSIAKSVKDVFVASAIEGSEEVFTDIANRIADGIINADMSEYHATVDKYILEGYSQTEAEKKANEDFLVQLFESFYGGAIGGGLGGLGKIALNTVTAGANAVADKIATNRAEYEAGTNVIANENLPNLIEEANASGNDKLMDLAKTVSESKNEKKSDVRKVGKLAMEVTKASADTYINATESVQSNYVESELKKSGVEATKENVAVINKVIANKNLQPKEVVIAEKINADKVAEKVLENAEAIENEANDIRKKAISTVQNVSFMRTSADAKTSETGKAYNTKTNEEVNIDSIASVNYNKKTGAYEMKLKLDNGEVIDAKDIKYKNASDSALFTAIETSGLDAESANTVLNMYDPNGRLTAYKYFLGMTEGIEYGRLGLDANKITSNNSWFGDLTPIQKETAIKLGKIATESKYKNAQERINEIRKKSEGKTTRNGKVTYLTDIMNADADTLTDNEKSAVTRAKSDLEMLQALSDNNIIANDIVVFSTEEVDGQRVFAQDVGEYKKGDVCPFNGFYNKKTGEIYVDVFSGSNGEGLVLNVVAHELTHFVRQWSPSDYKILADFVVEEYQNNGYDIDREIAIKRDRMQESRKSQVTNEEALEELVADSMQKMFVDGDLANKLAVLKFRSESLVGKLSDYLNKLSDKINKLARKEDSINKRLDIDKLAKNFSELADVFAEAVNNATNTFEVARAVLEDNGYQYDDETGTILASSRFSTARENEANVNREDLIKAIMVMGNVSKADAEAFVRAEETASIMVKGTMLDYIGNDLETAIKSNTDYPQGTIDLTNICTKRATITALTNNLQEALPSDLFTADDYADIRLIMMADGRTVACGLCYVEDRRQHLGEIAKAFITEWNKAAKEGTNLKRYNSKGELKNVSIGEELAERYGVKKGKVMPTAVKINQASLISSNAWHHIQKTNPLLAASFEAFNNARGQSAGRLLLDRAEYKREILNWSKAQVKKVNDAGGLRIFSFSDFEVIHLVDLMQIIEDCAAKGVKIQGYTKQADFARLIRNTGIKANRSLIPFGATGLKIVNGKKVLAIDSVEGLDINGENFMDETDNPNVGNNITGINDEQIKVAMLDNFIHYIIPFHTNKSGKVNLKLGVSEWKNYKDYQEDRRMESAEAIQNLAKLTDEYKKKGLNDSDAFDKATKELSKKNQKISSLPKGGGINIYTDVLSDPSIKNERQFTEKYLEVCRERNIVPRFAQFLNVNENGDYVFTPGYSKMLVDFKTFDYATGEYLPQQTVSLQFKDKADREAFDGYVRELVEKELKKTKEQINGEDYPSDLYNNILNYIRAKHGYKDADMKSYEKFKEIVDAQAKDTNSDEGKGAYVTSPSIKNSDRDSYGNKLSAAQQEYFKDSKVRDEEGHLIPVYHGTEANFTVFDLNKARTNMDIQGSFFSPWEIDARGYGSNIKMYYLNITNPASEAEGYNALKKFQRQNNAGIKARNYLIEKGYDGVNNGNEEYIAFYPEQIKLVDNLNPTTDKDIRFSDRDTPTDNRTLLANALATTTQNEIEANKIAEYQSKIQEMNAVQDELNKVRAELREQMFKKGGRKENFNDLKAKAQALANKINTYDKQLLRLESTQALKNVLEREKANAVKKAKAEYREMIANRKEKANNTEVRHKIKWLVDEFNRMQNHPTEKKYIPKSLIVPVNDLLMAVNLDSGRSEKLSEKLNTLYTQYSQLRNDPKNLMAYDETVADIIGKLATTIGSKSVYKMNSQELDLVYKALAGLMHVVKTSVKVRGIESNKNAYEISMKMKDETMSVDKTTNKFLKALKSPLKLINRSLRPETAFNRFGNYTKNSMWSKMYNVLNDGQTKQLRIQLEANSIFEDTFKKTKYLRSLTDTKNLVDVGLKDSNGNTVKITKGMALAIYKAMQNEDNMRHILRGGFTVPDLNAYYKGKGDAYGEGHINVRLVNSKKLAELRNELADINKQLEAKPDDLELLAQQGVIEYEIDKEIGNGDQLGLEMFHKIQDMLTPDDEQFLDEVKYLFDDYLRGELNKTTMELYGFEKAHIDNYLPIHTDPNFRTAQFESIAKDMSLENSGFMKDRVKASNPIMLEDLSTMVSSQIDKVARYSGLSVPIKDFQKVFGKSEINYNSSLQDALSSKFGNDAKKYIENLMADLVGGRMQETNIFDKLRGHMAGASLSVNPRVAFAQAASYPTAASEIGYKPLLKATKMGLKSADRELIAKYSPLLWYRNENGRDVEMGDVAKMSRTSDKLMRKTQWLMGWINAMDTATVGRLWYASQYYVDDNFNLEKGTDDYYMKVAEVFNRVVEKTQPNYTTLQRPDILRSTNSITKQLTMFMTQRLQNFNIVYDATAQYMKYRHDASQGLNGVTKSDVKEARVGLARAVSSQVIAGLMITGIKFGVDLLLHSMNGYKDKDKQLTWDSIINQLIKNFGETMISNIIGGSEVNELANSLISGDTYYGVSVTAVESFTDLVKGFLNEASSIKTSIDINRIRDDLRAEVVATLGEEALADAEADTIQDEIGNLAKMLGYTKTELNDRYGVNVNSDPKVVEKTRKLAESLAQLFGLPLRNIDKIAEGLMAHIDDAANGMLFNYIGQSEEEEERSAVFGDAMSKFNQGDMDGAVEIIKGIYQDKVAGGTEPSKAQSSVKSTMTNRLKPIYIKADASKRNEIRKLMYATGMYKSLDALDKVLAKWK